MLKNHVYNLVHQLAQENKSLWRFKNMYPKDAEGCEECLNFWKELEREKEDHVNKLSELVKKHLA